MKMHEKEQKVLILGGGVAGMQTAIALNDLGIASILVEKEQKLGGRVKNYDKTFPFFHSGKDLVRELENRVREAPLVEVRCGTTVSQVDGGAPHFQVRLDANRRRGI